MKNELFGVFGDRDDFDQLCSTQRFNRIVESEHATIGIRDLGYGLPDRSVAYEADDGSVAAIWGEVVTDTGTSAAKHLLDRYRAVGSDVFGELNGSYLAFVDTDGDAILATDPISSWECFYTDSPGVRVFGTDATNVAQAIPEATLNGRAIAEMTHFGVVFGEHAAFEELSRVPFDGYLTPKTTGELRRFVYDPQPPEAFDYVQELADRLQRAIKRRTQLPGRNGILLSAGYDSRIILSQHPSLDVGFTLGRHDAAEVAVSKKLAEQYGIEHTTLEVTKRYLDLRPEVIQYTQGVRESLHIHHRGNNHEIDVDSIYHGMLFDTLFRGFFLPDRGIDAFGRTFPLKGLDPDPDVPRYYADKLGGLSRDEVFEQYGHSVLSATSADEFARTVIGSHYDACYDRCENQYNAIDLLGIKQKPTLAFRNHLADHYIESFVAVDRELLEWHLKTPPEYRTDRTFLRALQRIDSSILHHSPPDRPFRSFRLNEIERVVREKLPGVRPFENPWPDRDELYRQSNLDHKLFPGYEEIYDLPPRVKLRMNDLTTWLEFTTGESCCTPDELLCPSENEHTIAQPRRADSGH